MDIQNIRESPSPSPEFTIRVLPSSGDLISATVQQLLTLGSCHSEPLTVVGLMVRIQNSMLCDHHGDAQPPKALTLRLTRNDAREDA